jgi:hypothetical protein
MSQITKVTSPNLATCALEAAGHIWCWGDNWDGQANPDSSSSRVHFPAIAVPGARFRTVANTWEGTCGISDDGVLWCWGRMGLPAGPLGPVRRVAVDTAFTEIISGGLAMYGRTVQGEVYSWGEYSGDIFATMPERLPFPLPMSRLTAGRFPVGEQAPDGVCGIATDGQVYCASPDHRSREAWRLTRAGLVPATH